MAAPKRQRHIDVMRCSPFEHALKTMAQMIVDRGYTILQSANDVDRSKRENPYFVAEHKQSKKNLVVFCDASSLKIVVLRSWLQNPWIADPQKSDLVDVYIFLAAGHASGIRQTLCQQNVRQFELWTHDQLVVVPHQHQLVPKYKVFSPEEARAHFTPDLLSHMAPIRTTDPLVRYFAYPVGSVLQELDTLRPWIVAVCAT